MLHLTGVLGVAAFIATWCLAVLLFAASPGRLVNRRLALLLLMVGIDIGTGGPGLLSMEWIRSRPDVAHGILALHFTVDAALPPLYLLFLASAFPSPITRFLARPTVTILLKIMALVGPAIVLWQMDSLSAGAPATTALFAYVATGFLLAFSIALHAFLHAARELRRSNLGTYLIAFGTLDLTWGSTFIGAALLLGAEGTPGILFDHYGAIVYPGGALVFGALLAYAVLRHQLLGIDVKIKWTLKQSTVAAIFIGLFFVVSEAAAAFFSDQIGTYLGILAAGLLVFAFAPLQQFAQGLADKAMPGVKSIDQMSEEERHRLFQEMATSAWAKGTLSMAERRLLDDLRMKLGLTNEAAGRLERAALDVLQGEGGGRSR